MKFIHISDLHIHRHPEDNEGAVSILKFIHQNYPEHKLIITGDIVDDGEEEQYNLAHTYLEPFKERIFICPGNHDFGLAGNEYSRERAERFDSKLSIPLKQGGTFASDTGPVVNFLMDEHDKIMLIALDTNLETKSILDFACGEVGERQLSFLREVLPGTTYADRTKILFFHHHPFIHFDPTTLLKDADKLMQTIKDKVDVVCFGHKHSSKLYQDTYGIPYILASDNSSGKELAREIDVTQKVITVRAIRIGQTKIGTKE